MLAALALAIAVASPGASAALYKWVDANGRTVYSDQPPMNVKAEIVGAAAPAANPDAVKEMAQKEAELKKRQSDRVDDAKKSEKARAEAQKLASLCTQARAQAAGLRRADVAMYRLNDKGERVFMEESLRKAEADRLDQLVKEQKCPPA
jgi:Domain of unknown function (DUF4124)